MKNKVLSKSIAAIMATTMLLGASLTVCAAPETGANISSQTIPVTATIDSYYEIGVPAGLVDGAIALTREHDDQLTTKNGETVIDTQGTFYGKTYVSIKGQLGTGKKVHVDLKCADLVESTEPSLKAAVGMEWLKDAQCTGTVLEAIWAKTDTTTKVNFEQSDFTAGDAGITHDFETLSTTETKKYAVLRTNLDKNGTYNSSLVINFSLA